MSDPTKKVKMDQELLSLENKPITDGNSREFVICPQCQYTEKSSHLTLRSVCYRSLVSNHRDEIGKISEDEMLQRARLAHKILNDNEVDLNGEDIKLIKKVVKKCYGTLPFARVDQLLDGRNEI